MPSATAAKITPATACAKSVARANSAPSRPAETKKLNGADTDIAAIVKAKTAKAAKPTQAQKSQSSPSPVSIFGTDGVRGRVGEEPITPQTVMKLGWAAGCEFATAGDGEKVLIGKDTRVSGYLLESALESGFSAAGVDVCFLGPLPTPGIAYLTRTLRACAGVVISASHNPYYDNGIKIFASDGTKLPDSLIAKIEARMALPMKCVVSNQLGKAERLNDAQGRYIEFCKSTLPNTPTLADLKIVIDCANGAAYDVAPHVFAEMGANVIIIGNQPDGFNINENCGSTDLGELTAKVAEHGADIGIALDGDADRVLLVDAHGRCIDGDQILYLLAKRRLQRDALGGGVVGTVLTNLGVELALQRMKIEFARARVGDRYVHEILYKNGWLLGGEASGHILCLDKNSTGDGIVIALEVLEIMLSEQRALHELLADLEILPQRMINVGVTHRNPKKLLSDARITNAVREAKRELGNGGRVVVRPSGTEPLVRVMIESEHPEKVDHLAQQVADAVAATFATSR